MQYIQDLPLGFAPENRITMTVRGADNIEDLPAFVAELTRDPGVLAASVSLRKPGDSLATATVPVESAAGAFDEQQRFYRTSVDRAYLPTLDISLVEGRNFDTVDLSGEGRGVLVNEAFVRQAGWSEPLGKHIGSANGDRVIGVVKNFH